LKIRTIQKQQIESLSGPAPKSTAPFCKGADHQGAGLIPPRARLKAEPKGKPVAVALKLDSIFVPESA